MFKRILTLVALISILLIITVHHPCAMILEEAMMRLQIEALKAQMDELLAQNDIEKARLILGEMMDIDEKIRLLSRDKVGIYVSISEQEEPGKDRSGKHHEVPREAGSTRVITTSESDDILSKYENAILDVCKRMGFDPAVIWTLLAIESSFSEDPVVIQRKTKCLGPWQHQPKHYIHYRKSNGEPYNPFDIYDACEVTVKILKDNLAVTGSLEKSIRMYASGSKYLDTPYEQLPRSVKDYLDKFKRLYSEAKARFKKYGIYAPSTREN